MSVPSPVAALARVMLALMFVMAGASKFANLEGTAGYIASGGLPMPAVLAVLTAALELLGGLALALGFQARFAALALAVFTVVASLLSSPLLLSPLLLSPAPVSMGGAGWWRIVTSSSMNAVKCRPSGSTI